MGKKRALAEDTSVEAAVLERLERRTRRQLTRFACGHVGAEIGVKAKAFVRWSQVKGFIVEDVLDKKCPDCK